MGVGAQPLSVAVCICTTDRPTLLEHALKSVLYQTRPADEVVVIDQSDGLATEHLVAAVQAREERVRYIRLNQKGLSRAYNTASANATSEVLAFTDDDCVAPPDWLEMIVRCFEEEPQVGLLYGQVLLPTALQARENVDGVTPALPIPSRRRMSKRDGYRVFGMGADFAARRSMLNNLGGFDEVLGGGGPLQSAQDFDLSYRAFRRGYTILLAPEVMVHHYGFRSHQDWPQTVRSYGIGIGGFYCKHVRLGDLHAARLLATVLMRQTIRATKGSLLRRGDKLNWTLLSHTLLGLRRSFLYSIDRSEMLYRPSLAQAV